MYWKWPGWYNGGRIISVCRRMVCSEKGVTDEKADL
jgi:hypothetical protein